MTYENIKRNYDRGLWSDIMVRICVRKGLITPEQYTVITGANY